MAGQLGDHALFPPLKDISLGLAYGIYATFAVVSFLFVARWVRETKGVQLEDMKGDLNATDRVRDIGDSGDRGTDLGKDAAPAG